MYALKWVLKPNHLILEHFFFFFAASNEQKYALFYFNKQPICVQVQ